MLAIAMFMAISVSAQSSVGSVKLIPKVGFNLANLAGDVSGNSIKFGLVGGADVMYQLSDLVGLSGGALLSMQGCEGDGDSSFSLLEINIPLLANFGSVRKAGCIHAHSFISLKRKKGMSETPLN